MTSKPISKKLVSKKSKSQSQTQRIGKLPSYRQLSLVIVAAAIALLGFYLLTSRAAVSPVVGGSPICGARVSNYTYTRPFGPNAAWNIPACSIPKWVARSDDWVNRLYNYAAADNGFYSKNGISTRADRLEFVIEFGLGQRVANVGDYSIPVYDAATATENVRVFIKRDFIGYNANLGGSWVDGADYNWNATIPWNPSWKPAAGNDGGLVVLDKKTGQETYLWAVSRADMTAPNNNWSSCFGYQLVGYNPSKDLCAAAAHVNRDPKQKIVDFRTTEGNDPAASGGGIQNYAGLVTADEVLAGEIRHAIKLVVRNTMFGPECPNTVSYDDPVFGSTCGSAVAPAGQFERISNVDGIALGNSTVPGSTPDERRKTTVPEGIRIALNLTDSEINTWLDGRGYTGQRRETARILAVALRDYGVMVTDSGGSVGLQTEGGRNPAQAKKWKDLGIDDVTGDPDFLFGLMKKEKMYALEPAYNKCYDGRETQYYCHASSTYYKTINSQGTASPIPQSTSVVPTTTVKPTTTATSSSSPTPATSSLAPIPSNPVCAPSYKQPCPTPTTITGPDTTPPSAPTEFKYDVRPDTVAFKYYSALSWKPSTDNVGVVGYVVTRNNQALATVAKTEYSDYIFTPDTSVSYQVQAKDVAGNLSPAASLVAQGKCFLIWCWAI